jgi:hypothetical protein
LASRFSAKPIRRKSRRRSAFAGVQVAVEVDGTIMNLSELACTILSHGLEDWIQMTEVDSIAQHMFPDASPDELREKCVGAIGELKEGGYARVGDLASDRFTEWSGQTGDILRRLDAEWQAVGRPNLGDIGWIENTPVGNRIGFCQWKKSQKQSS